MSLFGYMVHVSFANHVGAKAALAELFCGRLPAEFTAMGLKLWARTSYGTRAWHCYLPTAATVSSSDANIIMLQWYRSDCATWVRACHTARASQLLYCEATAL